MAFTYDLTTNRGKVRLLIRDNVSPGVLTDAEVDVLLELAGSVVPLAAALGLRNLATNEAYLNNEVRRGGYDATRQTVASALERLADKLDEFARDEGQFGKAVEQDWSDRAEAERIWRESLRESGEYLGGATG